MIRSYDNTVARYTVRHCIPFHTLFHVQPVCRGKELAFVQQVTQSIDHLHFAHVYIIEFCLIFSRILLLFNLRDSQWNSRVHMLKQTYWEKPHPRLRRNTSALMANALTWMQFKAVVCNICVIRDTKLNRAEQSGSKNVGKIKILKKCFKTNYFVYI